MERISKIKLEGQKSEKQECRELIGRNYDAESRWAKNESFMQQLSQTTIGNLDRKVKHGAHLTFNEAFCGMCYVLAATNRRVERILEPYLNKAYGTNLENDRLLAMASAFLNLMAAKESFHFLTSEEISGMVAATLSDPVITLRFENVIETCGMGGDKGFSRSGIAYKSINASTLSALVLSALGLPSVKHGSYGNTSQVGSTETIELFGAETRMISEEIVWSIWKKSGFCFFDAHWCKTIHDLSHLLLMETINHVIGPMTPPISPETTINKVMGVNEKIHPETVAQAYTILHNLGHQKMGGIIVVCGLSKEGADLDPTNRDEVRKNVVTDEVSPYTSVVALAHAGNFIGTFAVKPEHFGVEIEPEKIMLPNSREQIQKANAMAICGKNPALTDYLAMNAALGLFATEYLSLPNCVLEGKLNSKYLQECFARCHKAITSGKARDVLIRYVEATGGKINLPELT